MPSSSIKGTFSTQNRVTASAGTAFTFVVPVPFYGARTRITELNILSGSTAHLITIMKPLARTYATVAQAASDTSLTLNSVSRIGANMGSSDYVVVQHSDGTFGVYAVSAVNTTTKVVTISALSAAVAANAMVWQLGTLTSTPHVTFTNVASVLNRWSSPIAGLATTGYKLVVSTTVYSRSGNDDPLVVYCPNTTAAAVLESCSGVYGTP